MFAVQTVAPASEPITLAEAKLHLRVDVTDDDSLITALIVAARQAAEKLTGRALITQTWKGTLDEFPADGVIYVEPGQVSAVSSVKYIDSAGVQQTISSSDYLVDLVAQPARITPAFGKSWPAPRDQIAAVEVIFVTGYGVAAAVPQAIKQWMLLQIGAMYENREAVGNYRQVTLDFVSPLLEPYRVF